MSESLRDLLALRLEEEGMSPEVPISVAELHRRLLPYIVCRSRAGYVSKAEYDVGLLGLLADDLSLHVAEQTLRAAARAELLLPEPGLALLQRFAASEVRLRSRGTAAPEAPVAEPPADAGSDDGTDHEARGAEPAGRACLTCGTNLPDRPMINFCPSCGADQSKWPCPACGEEVEQGWSYCATCGKLLPTS
jgi:predicted RNA-binding Zn-ribbon protein involved in translation (DUF1610 family)